MSLSPEQMDREALFASYPQAGPFAVGDDGSSVTLYQVGEDVAYYSNHLECVQMVALGRSVAEMAATLRG